MREEIPSPIILYVENGMFMGKEIVFCKDCEYFVDGKGCILKGADYTWEEKMGADDFCSKGEKR